MKKIMLALFSLFALTLIISGCVDKEDDTTVRYYYPDSMTRILKEQELDGEGKMQTLSISLAGNEYEGGQFILNSDIELDSVKVTVGELKNESGQAYPAENISVYRQHYIYYDASEVKEKTELGIEPSYAGWYPNALIPMFDGSDGGFKNDEYTVAAGDNQGYWITVHADADIPAGVYTGNISITYGDAEELMPISVEVWDFDIPEKSTMETFYSYWPWMTSDWYEHFYPDLDVDMDEIHQTYMDFLRLYRIDIGPDSFSYDTDEEYIAGLKEQIEAGITKHYGLPFYYAEGDSVETLIEKNKDYYQKFEDAGILQYAYIYTVDEPHTDAQFEQVNKTMAAIRAMGFEKVRLLVTHAYEEGLLEDVSYWCPTAPYMSKEFIALQRAKGNDCAWYGYLPVSLTKTNDLHYTFWMSKYYDVAHLNWCTNVFKKFVTSGAESDGEYTFRDVWTDGRSFGNSVEGGYYIFPGAEGDGVVGRNIPVGTILLESIRDGLEEYEYFTILEDRYTAWAEAWGADITKDDIMYTYYYPSFTGFGNKYASADTSRTANIRIYAAEDILNEEEAIVAVLRAVNKDYEYSRDVVVYTPEEAEVVIEGHEVSPEKVNDCFKYTYTADAAETRVIEVTVNGKVYHRYIVPEKDDEYGTLIKDITYAAADKLGIELEEKFDIGSYMWDAYMTDLYTLDEDEAVRELKLSSIENLYHARTPVVLTVSDVLGADFTEKTFRIYAPLGAEVSVNGISAELTEEHESYAVYTASVDVGTEAYLISTVKVTVGGETEELSFLVHQKTGALNTLVDIQSSADAISAVAGNGVQEGYSVISDGSLTSSFGLGKVSGLLFDTSCLEITDISQYTHIRMTITNLSDMDAPGLDMTIYTEGLDKNLGDTDTIPAGETVVVDFALPDIAADKLTSLTSIYITSLADIFDETVYTYRIDDISVVVKQ